MASANEAPDGCVGRAGASIAQCSHCFVSTLELLRTDIAGQRLPGAGGELSRQCFNRF
jgi:hypothetical protein